MPNNIQFLDDPDDVPYINENITLHVSVDGDDDINSGLSDSPFRTLGKAIDVVKNKIIGKTNIVTIQLGAVKSNPDGTGKKYFEEEEINIDFESAKRLKIKGVKPTDHEVIGISYFDKASDREGYYCQVIVTNQDKISIGDYIGIYDQFKMKKKDPSYFWVRNNIKSPLTRMITPNNSYVEAIRCDMVLGVHEVVDISPTIEHDGIYSDLPTEIFYPKNLKIGAVTLHIKSNNHTYRRLNEVPFWNSLGSKGGDPIFTYAGGPGNSKNEAINSVNAIPPVFYGAEMLSVPETIQSQSYDQFYYASPVQQIEVADIMTRGYKFSLQPLDGKIADPRTGKVAKNVDLLWNDKTLNGYYRGIVAGDITSYFYKKLSKDLRIDQDLPFYFQQSSDPFVTIKQVVDSAKKIRDFLISGAMALDGLPPWEEDNHPGYGYGPFESGAVRPPTGGGAVTDKTSYPSEYADETKFSILLRYYNIYPPINGQLYQPTLIKRIRSWYNENATRNGLQLDRFDKKGNSSPFFCGYITPQGWYKQRYITNPAGTGGFPIPSLTDITDPNGYHRLLGSNYPRYVPNNNTAFSSVSGYAQGAFSNDRKATENLHDIDLTSYYFEASGLSSGGYDLGNTADYAIRGSMGTVWYSGLVNFMRVGGSQGSGLSQMGSFSFDRYSHGYQTNSPITTNDSIVDKEIRGGVENGPNDLQLLDGSETVNIRAKCYKSILRFAKSGIKVTSKTKLALIKDLCLVQFTSNGKTRNYGLVADKESTINASNIGISSFSCGISARNQSLINLLADLGNSTNTFHKGMFEPIDPAAIVTANDIGIESSLKSHVNAQRTISSGSKSANYLVIANSSMNCSNSISVSGYKHGFVCDFNSYMKATNSFSEFNAGIGYCSVNNSILICHRSRSIWNGSHGLFATDKSTAKCYEFLARSNDGDGILADNKSVISAGAQSSRFASYRGEFQAQEILSNPSNPNDYYGVWASLPPHMFQVKVVSPDTDPLQPIRLPKAAFSINSNPTHGINVLYHECNSTISEFNAGSGFASCNDSLIIADNTIARYNSKRYGEFFIYGWSGLRGSFPTDTFSPFEGN